MPNTPHTTKILLTGLLPTNTVPPYFRTLYGTPEEITAKVEADAQHIRDAGWAVTLYYMDAEDAGTGLEWLTTTLRGGEFAGIVVGSGLRLVPGQTELFERVVNVARLESPRSLFMFNYGPGTNFETVERNREKLLL
ncbi:hypothetical protein IQ07DRAFT_633336 [Pyrenochaeta sp. DS3sAY3a]|nr:hypothetical protein IQ07DRAFT_633336 [Pyrenochaeta sp. DS3sAY3a]